jgi:hypothetical protein
MENSKTNCGRKAQIPIIPEMEGLWNMGGKFGSWDQKF